MNLKVNGLNRVFLCRIFDFFTSGFRPLRVSLSRFSLLLGGILFGAAAGSNDTYYHMVSPGHIKYVKFPSPGKDVQGTLDCSTLKGIPYSNNGRFVEFYMPISYFAKSQEVACEFEYKTVKNRNARKVSSIVFRLVPYNYPSEKLSVPKKMVFPPKKAKQRIAREQKMLNKIYASSEKRFLFNEPFQLPLKSILTSEYGKRRLFNNKKQTQHLGNDFRAKTGTPILSTNQGIVRLSQDLYYTGRTIIIDHGLGIFSVYGHMSKLFLKEGERVQAGQKIGLSGATGRVTGPHLHWGVKVHGEYIDGRVLITESRIQFLSSATRTLGSESEVK